QARHRGAAGGAFRPASPAAPRGLRCRRRRTFWPRASLPRRRPASVPAAAARTPREGQPAGAAGAADAEGLPPLASRGRMIGTPRGGPCMSAVGRPTKQLPATAGAWIRRGGGTARQPILAEPPDAVDRAGGTAFRGSQPLQPARQLIRLV